MGLQVIFLPLVLLLITRRVGGLSLSRIWLGERQRRWTPRSLFSCVCVLSRVQTDFGRPDEAKSSWRAASLLPLPAGDGNLDLCKHQSRGTEANPPAPRHTAEIQTDTLTHTHTHTHTDKSGCILAAYQMKAARVTLLKMTEQSYQEQRPGKFCSTVMKLH